ncbi:hypothetical protein MA16_Dca023242 [Dendrobium catenatum]|uniref:Uncharacterized protein n=1 Tax=Dendrobium catenatum TaxID=906689 RepID=A0A2I0W1Y9_9ASPA|nr:hypothetical protein MA16_Dca023242 [Dendrobium catenatum]
MTYVLSPESSTPGISLQTIALLLPPREGEEALTILHFPNSVWKSAKCYFHPPDDDREPSHYSPSWRRQSTLSWRRWFAGFSSPVFMNALRSSGSLRATGKASNGIVIREGVKPLCRLIAMEGKGKNVVMEDWASKKGIEEKRNSELAVPEPVVPEDLILRVNNFSGVLDLKKDQIGVKSLSSAIDRKADENMIAVEDHLKKENQVKKVAEVVIEKPILDPIIEPAAERFEDEDNGKIEEDGKSKNVDMEVAYTELTQLGVGSQSGAAKIKLAKELRSLEPVEPDFKKKKRDGRVSSINGEKSPLIV